MKILKIIWSAFWSFVEEYFATKHEVVPQPQEIEKPVVEEVVPIQNLPEVVVEPIKYLFDTPQNARHSIRVICDEEGLSLNNKNIITACIEQESGFMNYYKNGNPVKRANYAKDGVTVWSTDWGICQINDTPGWHIGSGLAFPSVAYVLEHPEEVVRYMVKMQKWGKLKLWVSYSSGAYLKYMPQ